MKIKLIVTLILLSLASFILILVHATATETIDLSGEWDAIFIRMREEVGNTFDAEEDIVKIIQKGNEFVGKSMIGGKRIGKNEEAVKGKLSSGKLEEIFISVPIDQITFKLAWSKSRATINEDGDLILLYSKVKGEPVHITVVLKRKK
jgi:hypothetical protein